MVNKSNANYLINYLNKLIDCILDAQKNGVSFKTIINKLMRI